MKVYFGVISVGWNMGLHCQYEGFEGSQGRNDFERVVEVLRQPVQGEWGWGILLDRS